MDESTKGEEDEVEFQYKQGTDTYETLQDRLQRLHRDGMETFMREEIYYVSADYPEWLFSTYTGAKRKKAIEDLQNTIRILKFYSNNDFAFKDVHNEELFYQNGKILVEMVQLFEKYRIVYPSKHQFLGDLFEQLLNKGFKQNEGQFFTPMPITRFIWDSLPVDRMVRSERGTVYPKVIDYACGAGHFLTEAVEAINYFAQSDGNNAWARDHIYGIEKDYRLARVAKISLFMNGAGEGNIIFGDGLENTPDKGIDNGSFDILVANPPYSVKDFKQHLQLKNNSFMLLDRIGLNGGEIETLFVERIGQLLKPRGIAAVILPSSILSNDSASYTGAREQFLQNFYLRAIVAFGSKTFGATGTNTVVMFLEKFNEPPRQIDLSSDSVEAILSGAELTDWKDKEILEAYIAQIGVDASAYGAFLEQRCSLDELNGIDYFKMYVGAFADSADAKSLQKTRAYKNKSADEQAAAYLAGFYAYARSIEKEKLFYFSLVYRQTTVIITAPADNTAQKEFLGYDWSNRKGNEGIQIITRGGKMYDDRDRAANDTLAGAIKKSFKGIMPSFSDEQQKYASVVNTKDMFDFSREKFNKSMRVSIKDKITVESKYPTIKLGDEDAKLIEVLDSERKPVTSRNRKNGPYPYYGATGVIDHVDKYIFDGKYLLIGEDGAKWGAGEKCAFIVEGKCWINNHAHVLRVNENKINITFLMAVLNTLDLSDYITGKTNVHKLKQENLRQIVIPYPPKAIQDLIESEYLKIDKEYNTTRMTIESYRQKIEDLFKKLDIISSGGGYRLSLADPDKFDVSIGKRVLHKQLVPEGTVPVYSANVLEPFGHIDELLLTDFSVPSVLWGIDGDWMTSYIPADSVFYHTDHCGVLRCKTPEVNPRYMAHILETEGKKQGFSRAYRASIDRVQGISFTVPDRAVQDETIAQIEAIEAKLREAEAALEAFTGKTAEILDRFLH